MDHHNHSPSDEVMTTIMENNSLGDAIQGEHHNHVPSFLNDMDMGDGNKLLEMLHVPILHGGVSEVLLLPGLSTDSPLSFALACIVLVICVTLLEILRLLMWWVEHKYSGGTMAGSSCGCKKSNGLSSCLGDRKHYDTIHDNHSPAEGGEVPSPNTAMTQSKFCGCLAWFSIGGLQFVLYLVSTFLMLVAMTMNIHLIVSMALGSMIGKLTVVFLKNKIMASHK